MIPKTIHYCWFGRGKKPYLIRKCIESWRRIMPDYEIKEWNEDNFDVNINPFVQQAYIEKKWAFVADVCRFYACYTEGGIYLDTDVEVFKSFDYFLDNSFFSGIEYQEGATEYRLSIDASVFGCIKHNDFAKECLDYYNDKPFRNDNNQITGGTVQAVATIIGQKYGFKKENINQQLNNGAKIFNTDYFCNLTNRNISKSIYSLHHFDGSWSTEERGKLFQFCKKHDLLHIYRAIERVIHKMIR